MYSAPPILTVYSPFEFFLSKYITRRQPSGDLVVIQYFGRFCEPELLGWPRLLVLFTKVICLSRTFL